MVVVDVCKCVAMFSARSLLALVVVAVGVERVAAVVVAFYLVDLGCERLRRSFFLVLIPLSLFGPVVLVLGAD